LSRRDEAARTFEHLFSLESPRDPAGWPSVEDLAPPEAALDQFTFRTSLGSLGRHLVHGLAHLCQTDLDVDPDDFGPEVEVPQQVFVDAARRFGGHFFTRLVSGETRSDVPEGVRTTTPGAAVGVSVPPVGDGHG
jgi:hypothetical protein